MIQIEVMHSLIKSLANKGDSGFIDELMPYQLDEVIWLSLCKLLTDVNENGNIAHAIREAYTKPFSYTSVLSVTKKHYKTFLVATLPTDMYYPLHLKVEINGCNDYIEALLLDNSDELYLTDYNFKPNLKWRRAYFKQQNDDILVYAPVELSTVSGSLRYIARPQVPFIGGYDSLLGSYTSGSPQVDIALNVGFADFLAQYCLRNIQFIYREISQR
jgi:hypothetical protein